jgi:N4-gp56 family major capsid protein
MVRDAYFALCHTDLTADMDNIAGFIQKNQYPSPMNALRSEWGSIGNLRFLVSSIGSVFQNASNLGANIYNIFCVGMEAKVLGLIKFWVIDLETVVASS